MASTERRKTKLITFLSGKGGSGKTTLALSTAKMLCDCHLKVLLVDCDLATNGATYFFERFYSREKVLTVWDMLQGGVYLEGRGVGFLDSVSKPQQLFAYPEGQGVKRQNSASMLFSFVPTNTYFDRNKPTFRPEDKDYEKLKVWLRQQAESGKYDAILCDCQAGYSPALDAVLHVAGDEPQDTFSCVNIIPMEQDIISATATRVLYARIPEPLDRDPTYIVFNKIHGGTKALKDLTDTTLGGTLFPMLSPIQFYISVFQSFATGDIPDMLHTDADFGRDIHSTAMKLLPEKRNELLSYTETILNFESKQLQRREQGVQEKRRELKSKRVFADTLALIVAGGCLTICVGLSGIVGEWMERLLKINIETFALCYGIGITTLGALIFWFAQRLFIPQKYREDVVLLKKDRDELKEKQRQNDEKRQHLEDMRI